MYFISISCLCFSFLLIFSLFSAIYGITTKREEESVNVFVFSGYTLKLSNWSVWMCLCVWIVIYHPIKMVVSRNSYGNITHTSISVWECIGVCMCVCLHGLVRLHVKHFHLFLSVFSFRLRTHSSSVWVYLYHKCTVIPYNLSTTYTKTETLCSCSFVCMCLYIPYKPYMVNVLTKYNNNTTAIWKIPWCVRLKWLVVMWCMMWLWFE